MKAIIAYLFILVFPSHLMASKVKIGDWEFTTEEIAEMEAGLQRWQSYAQAAPNLPRDEAIPELAKGLYKTSIGSVYVVGDRQGTFKILQNAMISIPGHAEYQKKIIDDALSTLELLPKDRKIGFLCGYRRTQADVFKTLALLPSPETVRVLGDFLSDENGGLDYKEGDPFPTEDDFLCQQIPNCQQAATALCALIDDPLSKRKLTDANLEQQYHDWRLWYNQIKAGTKPIRFKGDPKEYHLENVERAREASRAIRRPSTDGNARAESNKTSQTVPLPWIASILVALIALGGWLFMKQKRRA